jgi:hypothetical protein
LPGKSFVEAINSALTDASYLIILISAHSLESSWVTREWTAAMSRKETVILPVRLDGSELPPLLAPIKAIDWNDRSDEALGCLVNALKADVTPLSRDTLREPRRSSVSDLPDRISRRQLRLIAQRCLGQAEIDAYANDFDVDRGRLETASPHARIQSLMYLEDQDGRLGLFAEWIFRERTRCAQREYNKLRGEDVWTGIRIV